MHNESNRDAPTFPTAAEATRIEEPISCIGGRVGKNSIVKRVLSGVAALGIALSGLALGAASVWWNGFCETDGEWVLGVGLVEWVLRNRW